MTFSLAPRPWSAPLAVGDRHVSEFFPWLNAGQGGYYGQALGVDAFSLEDTIAGGDRIFAEMREVALSPAPLPDNLIDAHAEHLPQFQPPEGAAWGAAERPVNRP